MSRLSLISLTLTLIFALMLSLLLIPPHLANVPHTQNLIDAFAPGNCDSLCWHGIIFGKTTLAEAQSILSADPAVTMLSDGQGCQVRWKTLIEGVAWQGMICAGRDVPMTDPVKGIYLYGAENYASTNFTLLDSVYLFGRPTGAACTAFSPFFQQDLKQGSYFASLTFHGGPEVSATRQLPYGGLLFDPFMPISGVRYGATSINRYYRPGSWRGFTSEHFERNAPDSPCQLAVE
jgi:hypothetical protein